LPTVTAEVFTIALAHFAQSLRVGKSKRVLLVLDRAGWHTSKELVVPEGIHLLFLPPYSPELQQMSNACGRSVMKALPIVGSKRSMSLQTAQVQRCALLQNQPEAIRSLTHFHWWPPAHSKQK
jgi:transposase